MYKIVDYGTYYAISTWTHITGKVLQKVDDIDEARRIVKALEKGS
jgi:hypothetical protein